MAVTPNLAAQEANDPPVSAAVPKTQPPGDAPAEEGSQTNDSNSESANYTESIDPQKIPTLIQSLRSHQFHERVAATGELTRIGLPAVDALSAAVMSGDPELISRSITILYQIALRQSPRDGSIAQDRLVQLLNKSAGSTHAQVAASLRQYRDAREKQAITKLAALGVHVDGQIPMQGAYGWDQTVDLHFAEDWPGDVDQLFWLQWLPNANNVLIDGSSARREVFRQIAGLPNLTNLVIRYAHLEKDALVPLKDLKNLQRLKISYTKLDDDQIDALTQIPVGSTLHLQGTGWTAQQRNLIETRMPFSRKIFKQGGFMGIKGTPYRMPCEINEVIEGGAAIKAGLQKKDIVIRVNQNLIRSFEDLQQIVGSYEAGDVLTITYIRDGETATTKLTLQRQEVE